MIIGPPKRSSTEPGPKPLNLLLDDEDEDEAEEVAEDVGEKKEEGEPISRGMGFGTWGGSVALETVLEVEMSRLISAREEVVA